MFEFHMIVGKGGFGKVWIVTLNSKNNKKRYYALKEMEKARILMKNSVKSVINERKILLKLKNDFIVNIKGSF